MYARFMKSTKFTIDIGNIGEVDEVNKIGEVGEVGKVNDTYGQGR